MVQARAPAGTLGEVLASQRRRVFVGRDAELELVRMALASPEATFSVLWLKGPGGIGKSALLDAIAHEASLVAGWQVARVDGRQVTPSPKALTEAIDRCRADDTRRLLILIDAFEHLETLDDWVRCELLPSRPADSLTVIAGRDAPGAAWRSDAGWRHLLRVVALRNLDTSASHRYLEACGVDSGRRDRLVALTHGHPLALSLVADVIDRGGEADLLDAAPDLISALLERFLDAVPVGAQRRALEVCALSRTTTEPLLRAAVGASEAPATFEWLRSLSFVESQQAGLCPHDLAREVVDAELRWRDPTAYRKVFRQVRAHATATLRDAHGVQQQHAAFDLKFLFRNLPSVLSPVDWDTWGHHHPEVAEQADRSEVLGLIEAAEGPRSAMFADRWFETQADGFSVLRDDGGEVRGVIAILDLTAATAADRRADPGTWAAWTHAAATGPPRPGELVTQTRFVVDRDAYQDPSPTLNAVPIVTLLAYLRRPHLARDYLTLHEPDAWNEFFALADFPRVAEADFSIDQRRFGLFSHDFRAVPVDALMELWTERALEQDPAIKAPTPTTLVLSHEDFTAAVRRCLRDLKRPDRLEDSPLLRTRLLVEQAAPHRPSVAHLAQLIESAVAALGEHPRDAKLLRALHRTYLQPAATQEAAAEVLDLPFSTYRRHLSQGVERVVAWLWHRELHGVVDQG